MPVRRRQYAIKKIPLDVHTPSAYARIMREVTTLSRLQHPNVVRYFQAGFKHCHIPSSLWWFPGFAACLHAIAVHLKLVPWCGSSVWCWLLQCAPLHWRCTALRALVGLGAASHTLALKHPHMHTA